MALPKDDELEKIANMSVMELVELVEAMEEKFGISAEAAAFGVARKNTTLEKSKDAELARLVEVLKDVSSLKRNEMIRESYLDFLSANSLSLNSDNLSLTRIIPISIYLADGENSEEIMVELYKFCRTLGFEIVDSNEAVIASYFKKLWARTFNRQTKEELEEALNKTKEALETQQIEKPKSEINLNNANAAAALLNAMQKESKSRALLVGNILLITIKDENDDFHDRVITLNTGQLEYVQNNLEILKSPEVLLKKIDDKPRLTGTS